MKLVFACLLTALLAVGVCAQDAATEAKPKAIQPEVQTAEWAVKWWLPRHEQKLKDLAKMGDVDLLMIGDSITHGWENTGKQVWDQYYGDRKAFNLGFSGDRTEQVLWRLEHGAVKGISPKLAVVMIGTNNAGHRQDPAEETAAGIEAIVKDLRQRLPETKILLLGIFPRGEKPDDKLRRLNDETNETIARLADDEQVVYLDLSETFLDDEGLLPKSVMPDLLHPNEQGYQKWAAAMEPTIRKLMGEKPGQNAPQDDR
jgi:lysophospholipase L1-like esterase